METKPSKYMNPYLAGFLLGLVLLMAFYVAGRGLGSSGAIKSVIVATTENVAPQHAENSKFFQLYSKKSSNPLKAWLVFEMLGVFAGAFISGLISQRLQLRTEKGAQITVKRRWVFALIGGILFGLGAQFGRGCTSGAALTGMAVLSTGGIVTMMGIFGTGYALAYFARKLWLKG